MRGVSPPTWLADYMTWLRLEIYSEIWPSLQIPFPRMPYWAPRKIWMTTGGFRLFAHALTQLKLPWSKGSRERRKIGPIPSLGSLLATKSRTWGNVLARRAAVPRCPVLQPGVRKELELSRDWLKALRLAGPSKFLGAIRGRQVWLDQVLKSDG